MEPSSNISTPHESQNASTNSLNASDIESPFLFSVVPSHAINSTPESGPETLSEIISSGSGSDSPVRDLSRLSSSMIRDNEPSGSPDSGNRVVNDSTAHLFRVGIEQTVVGYSKNIRGNIVSAQLATRGECSQSGVAAGLVATTGVSFGAGGYTPTKKGLDGFYHKQTLYAMRQDKKIEVSYQKGKTDHRNYRIVTAGAKIHADIPKLSGSAYMEQEKPTKRILTVHANETTNTKKIQGLKTFVNLEGNTNIQLARPLQTKDEWPSDSELDLAENNNCLADQTTLSMKPDKQLSGPQQIYSLSPDTLHAQQTKPPSLGTVAVLSLAAFSILVGGVKLIKIFRQNKDKKNI